MSYFKYNSFKKFCARFIYLLSDRAGEQGFSVRKSAQKESELTPENYFANHEFGIVEMFKKIFEDDEIQSKIEHFTPRNADCGIKVQFEFGGEKYSAEFRTKFEANAYTLNAVISDAKGKKVYERTRGDLYNITDIDRALALTLQLAAMELKELLN